METEKVPTAPEQCLLYRVAPQEMQHGKCFSQIISLIYRQDFCLEILPPDKQKQYIKELKYHLGLYWRKS